MKYELNKIHYPYPGLRAFEEEESSIFFGREEETQEIESRLKSNRQVFIIGDSGSGKSSLLFAGILPRFTLDNYYVCVITPGKEQSPFLSLVRCFYMNIDENTIHNKSKEIYETCDISLLAYSSNHKCCLICLDQFEEIFSSHINEEVRYRFLYLISKLCQSDRFIFLATFRIDFLEKILKYESVCELLQRNTFILAPLTQTPLYRAIVTPADMVGIKLDTSLVERIIDDQNGEVNALPLIACALRKLHDIADGSKKITLEQYESFDGLHGIIAKSAEVALNKYGNIEQELFDKVFGALVNIDESTMRTVRRRALVKDLFNDVNAKRLVDEFIKERLFVSSKTASDEPTIEVAHEAIFVEWKRLSDWLEEKGKHLQLIRRMQIDALAWERNECQASALPSHEALVPVYNAIKILEYKPTALESKYIELEEKRIWNILTETNLPHQNRASLGVRLNEISDTRKGIGLNKDNLPDFEWVDCSRHFSSVKFGDYTHVYVSKYLVTWAQYRAYLQSHRVSEQQNHKYDNHPADMISWVNAHDYCLWISEIYGINVRLPTVAEWQRVAKMSDKDWMFPWGNEFISELSNTQSSGLNRSTAVGIYPITDDGDEIYDLIGNLWEWCNDAFDDELFQGSKYLCGGSFRPKKGDIKIANTLMNEQHYKDIDFGFRLWKFEG